MNTLRYNFLHDNDPSRAAQLSFSCLPAVLWKGSLCTVLLGQRGHVCPLTWLGTWVAQLCLEHLLNHFLNHLPKLPRRTSKGLHKWWFHRTNLIGSSRHKSTLTREEMLKSATRTKLRNSRGETQGCRARPARERAQQALCTSGPSRHVYLFQLFTYNTQFRTSQLAHRQTWTTLK